ncbi:hypothetical protein [Mycobacterium sp.]|uniref:hypothetical protein n=2 Tax=unclassified Mycobacterium TaxID=2642494 RepID=UPI0031D36511
MLQKSHIQMFHQATKGASMNAEKTGKGMQTVKILVAVAATLFAVLSAGCAAQAPTGTGVAPASQAPAH